VNGTHELVRRILEEREDGEALRAADGLSAFVELLIRANEAVNLVSRREAEPETLVRRHLLDALEALPLLPSGDDRPRRLLDVGSGGGFPAIPLLVVRRDLEAVLVESIGKKARFLAEATRALGLRCRVVPERFPHPAVSLLRGEPRFDVVTSRAVAGAGEIVRQARPVAAPSAVALLWTSEALLSDISRALPAASVAFRKSQGAERRGIARVERFT
jgi:16S rRNA (guanine527-N7)-methyltransferase